MNIHELIGKLRTWLSFKVFTTLIFGIFAVLLFLLLFPHVKPETYDMELFSVADKTIRSPKTFEDEQKTEEERHKAAEEVEKVYVYKKEKAQNRVSLVSSIFDFVKETNKEAAARISSEDQEESSYSKAESIQGRLATLKSKLTANVNEDVTQSLPDEVFMSLLKASNAELTTARTVVVSVVEETMKDKIREEQLPRARDTVSERIRTAGLDSTVRAAAEQIGRYAVAVNEVYDSQLTEDRKQQAMESVEPVKILQGQVVVQEGHLIDRETYRQLELLGFVKNGAAGNTFPGFLKNPSLIKPYVGLFLFIVLVSASMFAYFFRLKLPEDKKQNSLVLTAIVFLISIFLMKIVSLMEELNVHEIRYIFPAAMAPMLIRVMLNERIALIVTIVMAACGSLIFHDSASAALNVEAAIYILFSGLAGILLLTKRNKKNNILQAGMLIAIVNMLVIFFLLFVVNGQFTKMEYLYYVLYAFISGLLSAVLTMGMLPFLEAGFGILSTMKLIELSNPNHPLLKKILTEAPGTYHHSVMVGNLAESACEAIGADGLLARVGCYYHDIGKTKRPQFFIENQMNIENPHDKLPPSTSRDIIIAHVTDGVAELKKHKLPKEIVDIAEQHHGTTLLKIFYYKAKERDESTEEELYRYPGPRPQTKEAAVISIADSVEAAVRSMPHPTQQQIRALVHNIAQDRLLDGQLSECDITLKELEIIKKTFCETLNGIFHSRIEYPDFKKQKVN